jgi:Lar family restriction alleviation protein
MKSDFPISNPPHLEPCPFCGGAAYLIRLFIPFEDDDKNVYQVGCEECEIERQQLWDYDALVKWWNKRAKNR